MKINVIAMGKIKEPYLREALLEYEKRLSRYVKFEIIELPEEKYTGVPTPGQAASILDKEADKILRRLDKGQRIITLEIEGEMKSSSDFSRLIEGIQANGRNASFIIGSSLGLSQGIKNISHTSLSFSPMTFPHMLMRVILLEQIYRAFTIINNEPYHRF